MLLTGASLGPEGGGGCVGQVLAWERREGLYTLVQFCYRSERSSRASDPDTIRFGGDDERGHGTPIPSPSAQLDNKGRPRKN